MKTEQLIQRIAGLPVYEGNTYSRDEVNHVLRVAEANLNAMSEHDKVKEAAKVIIDSLCESGDCLGAKNVAQILETSYMGTDLEAHFKGEAADCHFAAQQENDNHEPSQV